VLAAPVGRAPVPEGVGRAEADAPAVAAARGATGRVPAGVGRGLASVERAVGVGLAGSLGGVGLSVAGSSGSALGGGTEVGI